MTNTITPAMRDAGAKALKTSVGWLSTAAGLFYVAHKVYAAMESARLNTPPREARPGDWMGRPFPFPCDRSKGGATACSACDGKTYRLATRGNGIHAIERCDTCSMHLTDEDATVLAGDIGRRWVCVGTTAQRGWRRPRNWAGKGGASCPDRGARHKLALEAIQARINGEWDHPALVSFGPLMTNSWADVAEIIRTTLAEERA